MRVIYEINKLDVAYFIRIFYISHTYINILRYLSQYHFENRVLSGFNPRVSMIIRVCSISEKIFSTFLPLGREQISPKFLYHQIPSYAVLWVKY